MLLEAWCLLAPLTFYALLTIVIGLNVYSDLQFIPCNASVEAEKGSMDSSGGGDAQGTCFLCICFCHQYYFNDMLLGKMHL